MSMNCKRCENFMAQALYGDLSPGRRAKFEEHLQGCAQCGETFRQFEQTVAVANRRVLAQADDETMKGFWDRLEPQLERQPAAPVWNLFPGRWGLKSWANHPAVAAAAAMVLVAVGIFIGRINPNDPGGTTTQAAALLDPAITADFNEQFSSYLDRTKLVLLGLDNYQEAAEDETVIYDLTRHRAISRELITQGRNLKAHAAISSHQLNGVLIDDIERILLQLANSDDLDIELTIEIIQKGMNRNGIMFKITLSEFGRLRRERSEPLSKKSSIIAFYGKDSDDV